MLASTVDDAIGEAFDKGARTLQLPYPGGVHVDALAQQGKANIPLCNVVVSNGNFSYSGIKTAVINYIHNNQQKSIELNKQDICASFNYYAVDGLINRFVQLANSKGITTLAVAGGVAANSYLRNRLEQLKDKGFSVFLPQMSLCGDNASMIASRAYYMYLNKQFADNTLTACPTLKLRGNRPS